MKTIAKIIQEMNFPVKGFEDYSFGDLKTCRELFEETFFEVDNTCREFKYIKGYDQIIEWMTDSKGKGLALFGSVGNGKTIINSFVMPVLFYAKFNKILHPQEANKLTKESLNKWSLLIDDIGTEFIVNDYGTKIDMVADAINDAEHNSKLLFLTSNLTKDEIITRYGLRTFDRIKRLCKIVIFTGNSMRL